MVKKHESSAERVMAMIIKDIRMGKFPDGRITSSGLVKKYNEGITIVREALHRLVGRGFVYLIPNKGYLVPVDMLRKQLDAVECYIKLINPFATEMIDNFTYDWAGSVSSKASVYKMLLLEYDGLDHSKDKARALELLELLFEAQVDYIALLKDNFSPALKDLYDILCERMIAWLGPLSEQYKLYQSGLIWHHSHFSFIENLSENILKKDKMGVIKALTEERKDYLSMIINYDQKRRGI